MAWLLLVACTTTTTTTSLHCFLDKPSLDVSEAAPGQTVVGTTGPLTTAYDTAVRVGSTSAPVLAVTRASCDACDACRTAASCTSCDECSSCAADCSSCEETVSFSVPSGVTGPQSVVITNLHATAPAVSLTVTEAVDTGGDSGEF